MAQEIFDKKELSLFVSLVFLLLRGEIGESRPAAAALNFTSKPPDPTFVVEGNNLTFEWNFTLGYHTVRFVNLIKRNGSIGIKLIERTFSPGKVAVLGPGYKHRVRGEVSNTTVKVTILGVERSDHGKYILNVIPFSGALIDEVTVIVQSIGVKNVYLRLMIIDEECTPGDQSFWEKLKPEVNKIFSGKNGYNGTQLLDFRCGRMTVDLVLTFNDLVAEDVIISTLRNAIIKNGKLGELRINASSIVGIPPVNTSTAAPPSSKTTPKTDDNKTLIIVVSVIVVVVLLVVVIVVVACCIRKKNKNNSKVHAGDHDGDPGRAREQGSSNEVEIPMEEE